MIETKTDLLELCLEGGDRLREWLSARGQPGYRAEQIRGWVMARRASSFEEMTDLPLPLRTTLEEEMRFWTTTVAHHTKAEDGTEKLLLSLHDGQQIECVLIRAEGEGEKARRSICISSQVGCAMGCVFCASGLDGVDRNLTTAEMVEQMQRMARLLPEDERISHVVVMGMGEPLANLDAVLPALEEAGRQDGLGISPRRITISTVGLPDAIDRLVALDSKYNLAVSLHAPHDALRNELVPVNRNTRIGPILDAADRYFDSSGRRLTFEYVLLGGVNDHPAHAKQLAALLKRRVAMLNLIPYNPVAGLPYETPTNEDRLRFVDILSEQGINVQVRMRKGSEIDAACGQLRRIKGKETPPQ